MVIVGFLRRDVDERECSYREEIFQRLAGRFYRALQEFPRHRRVCFGVALAAKNQKDSTESSNFANLTCNIVTAQILTDRIIVQ